MKPKYDAIIVLGGGRFNSGELTPLSTQRLDKGIELFKEGVALIICALGEHKSTYRAEAIDFDVTGAKLRKRYFIDHGIPEENIVKVEEGRDTIGEAFASRKVLRERGARKLLVVTSDKHLERSLFVFRRVFGENYKIDGYPVPCGNLLNSQEEREYLEVVKKFFISLPKDIPVPNPDLWYQEHAELYEKYGEIHDRFHANGKESQAYSGVKK